MKTRLILLSLIGVAVYIVLANFNSKMVKEAALPKDHGKAPVQQPLAKSAPTGDKTAPAPVAVKEPVPEPAPKLQEQPVPQAAAPQEKTPEPAAIQPTDAQTANGDAMQHLQEEIALKDRQIRQLLDSQEALAAKYRAVLAETAIKTDGVVAKDKQLAEHAEQVKALTADKEKTATELTATKTALAQLHQDFEQLKIAGAEVKDKVLKESGEQIKAVTAEKEKLVAELQEAKALAGQLGQTLEQVKTAGAEARDKILKESSEQIKAVTAEKEKLVVELRETKALSGQLGQTLDQIKTASMQNEQLLREKETLLKAAQTQMQEQTGLLNQVRAQLAETADKLTATKVDLTQAMKKAEDLIRLGAEKEQLAATLNDQKAAVEHALREKSEALDKATLAIHSLRQEVAAQPQAVATVQGLLDARIKEHEQLKAETSAQIEQLRNQVAALGKKDDQTAQELAQYKTEAETARKKAEELDAALATAQVAQTEAEKSQEAATQENAALLKQLAEKETALASVQAHINELAAKTTALNDEKLGLASQLQAMQADQKNLLAVKASFDAQAAALANAEGKLKQMAALQAKNEEMNKALEEKTTALEKAARQGEELAALQTKHAELSKQADASAGALKQLEAEKSDLMAQLATAQAQVQNVDGLKKALDEKSNTLMLAETKIKDLEGVGEQIAALETKLTAALTAKQAAEKKVGEVESSIKNLNESLSASNGKVKTLESDLATARTRIKELTDKHQLQEQQDLVPTLQQQIATLREQIGQLEATSTQTKKALAEATAAMQANTEAAQEAGKQVQALTAEKEGLQQSLSASQATIEALNKQLGSLKTPPAAAAPVSAPATQAESPTTGRATDADHDGVGDAADLCPGSPAGSSVNPLGCPAQKGIVLEGVNFATGTAALTPESRKKLDEVAGALSQAPQVKIEVAGYTDSMGDAKRNLNLSGQRAQAVVKYLTDKGVAAAQLTAKGYGAENPVADNNTAAGRQKNRRIELHPVAQ